MDETARKKKAQRNFTRLPPSLLREVDLAPLFGMVQHLLLEKAHLFSELLDGQFQLRVLAFQLLDLVLEMRDLFQLPFSALAGGNPIPVPLPLQLDPLLVGHVDGALAQRREGRAGEVAGDGLVLLLDRDLQRLQSAVA